MTFFKNIIYLKTSSACGMWCIAMARKNIGLDILIIATEVSVLSTLTSQKSTLFVKDGSDRFFL